MSIQDLNQEEISVVSGASIGDAIIHSVNAGNSFLNSPLISSVGVVFSAVGLGLVHQTADTTGLAASKVLVGIGRALGSTVPETLNHYEKEQSEGLYTPLPTLLFGRR